MIRFELPPNDGYIMSSTVTGTLIWVPQNDKTINWIMLRLKWSTSGRGDTESNIIAKQEIEVPNPIVVGQEYRWPFSLTLPLEGPISYYGQLLNIEWEIEAEFDISWAINPTASTTITVTPFPVRL